MRKWFVSLVLVCMGPCGVSAAGSGRLSLGADTLSPVAGEEETRYYKSTQRYTSNFAKLIPNQTVLQYAGSIGLFSVGLGWHYGRAHRWETDLLVGFVPRYASQSAKATFTVKERFIPWKIPVGRWWTVEPLTAGLFFNTIFGEDFWAREPSKYPKSYYGFSTKIRTNVFLGQRFCYLIPLKKRLTHKSVAFYYELSTCDLYVISAVTNRRVRPRDILSLCFGLTLDIF